MEANVKALEAREPQSESLKRYHELGPLLTGEPQANAQDAVAWVRRLCQTLKIPSLKTHGLTGTLIPDIAQKSRTSSSMKGNPIVLGPEELEVILLKAL